MSWLRRSSCQSSLQQQTGTPPGGLTFNKHLIQDFQNSKVLAITRNPIYNFWRRAYSDEKVEQERFDITDCEYIKNYRYINRLRDLCLNFKNLNNKFKKY